MGCSDSPSPINSVQIQSLDSNHFKLNWPNNEAIYKLQNDHGLKLIYKTSDVPKQLFALLQSLSWLNKKSYQNNFNMHNHYQDVKSISPQTSVFRLTYYTILYGFKLNSFNILKSIEEYITNNLDSFGPRQFTRLSSLLYFYMAILSDNWPDQKTYLLKSTSYEGQERKLKNYAQIFSLSILKLSITYYYDELNKVKYYKKLGMDEALEGQKWTVKESLGQVIGNTFNIIRYNIPQYKNQLESRINDLTEQMQDYTKAIDLLLIEAKKGQLLSEIDLTRIVEKHPKSEEFFNSQAYQETKTRGVFSNYVISGRWVSLPTLQSLRLYKSKEFLYPYWNDRIISEGVNLWSIMLLVKGPQIVEIVLGLGGTHKHVKVMSLRSIWTQPWEWTKSASQSFSFWVKAETLDGCLPTWSFIIASAFTPDANNNIDSGIPYIDDSFTKKDIPRTAVPGTYGL